MVTLPLYALKILNILTGSGTRQGTKIYELHLEQKNHIRISNKNRVLWVS